MQDVEFAVEEALAPEEFVDLMHRSALAERRPVDDDDCVAGMLRHADLIVTARADGRLVGVARSVTDFAYCCYLSDLAVDAALQRGGIGRELVRLTRERLGPRCALILLAAPAAAAYYPRLGFEAHPSAWVLRPDEPVS